MVISNNGAGRPRKDDPKKRIKYVNNIRALRVKAKLSQVSLAASIGISQAKLSSYESGKEFPKDKNRVDSIACALAFAGKLKWRRVDTFKLIN